MVKLDYVPRLVAANDAHRLEATPVVSNVFWLPASYYLNQVSEGACVGGGVVNEYGASPFRGKINDALMFDVYNNAKQIDEWEGVNYEGTSVRAGMLVGRQRGWWTGFKWAYNMAELDTALTLGPVVIGVEWYESMYEATNGIVRVEGDVVGGHCILLTGRSMNHNKRGKAYRWRNSWGREYGINGNAYIYAADLKKILFDSGGEAAVPVGRKLVA